MSIRIGIAPIGWTNDDLPELGGHISFEQCIKEMSLAGYEGTEIGNKYPKDPNVLREKLASEGLQIANAWFSSFVLTNAEENIENFKKACLKLQILGASKIGISEQSDSIQGQNKPIFGQKKILSAGEWQKLTSGINELGKISKEEFGIDLVYHHHMGTVIQTADETRMLLDNTNNYVSLLFDTGHFAYIDEDYISIFEEYFTRIKHIHLKDVRRSVIKKVKEDNLSFLDGVKLGTFTVPGDGDIDFAPVFNLIKVHNYAGWVLVEAEQDPERANPFVYAKKAMQYIKKFI